MQGDPGDSQDGKRKDIGYGLYRRGTPTTLSAGSWDRLLSCIEQSFSMETVQEFTVEAGRPDSITKEKLKVIREISGDPDFDQSADDAAEDA